MIPAARLASSIYTEEDKQMFSRAAVGWCGRNPAHAAIRL